MQEPKDDDAASNKPKVLFIRLDESLYEAVATLADDEDRTINSMAKRLLKEALAKRGVNL